MIIIWFEFKFVVVSVIVRSSSTLSWQYLLSPSARLSFFLRLQALYSWLFPCLQNKRISFIIQNRNGNETQRKNRLSGSTAHRRGRRGERQLFLYARDFLGRSTIVIVWVNQQGPHTCGQLKDKCIFFIVLDFAVIICLALECTHRDTDRQTFWRGMHP